MKYLAGFLFFVFLLSCNKDPNISTDLNGSYKMTEQYFDPGDGGGDFQSVNSNRLLTLNVDLTARANGDMCTLGIDADKNIEGSYSIVDSMLIFDNCVDILFSHRGTSLLLYYPCIEPCIAKYEKQ